MSTAICVAVALLIPLLGTTLGSAMVFFLKGELPDKLQKALLGFASGVIIAASVWSLLIPSIEMASESTPEWFPAAVGFLVGMGFLLLLDSVVPHLHLNSNSPEGKNCNLNKNTMLVFAVALHNLPEGMAVGVVISDMLSGNGTISVAAAFVLSLGIAIQNFPEGAIISLHLASMDMNRRRAFYCGFASSIMEPIGALLTILLSGLVLPILPYVLSFAAGAMIYVVVEELISKRRPDITPISAPSAPIWASH